ncbi:MAG TPA: alpha-N-arabinofuranosidase, partial [Ruminococcus sp.]|nr:alpha-N-arabinofuranosidase [Ruminococcus sp.]
SGTGSEYCVGRLEADINSELMDISSWRKLDHPVLSTADLPGESGPGHNSFVTDEMGNLLIVYHSRPDSHSYKECGSYSKDPLYDPCRHTRIKRVVFSSDRTPVINLLPDAEIRKGLEEVTAAVTVN